MPFLSPVGQMSIEIIEYHVFIINFAAGFMSQLYVDTLLVFSPQHLYASFEEEPGFFQFATAITSNDVEEVQKFLDTAVDARYHS